MFVHLWKCKDRVIVIYAFHWRIPSLVSSDLLSLLSLTSVLDLNAFERQNKAEGLGMVTEEGTREYRMNVKATLVLINSGIHYSPYRARASAMWSARSRSTWAQPSLHYFVKQASKAGCVHRAIVKLEFFMVTMTFLLCVSLSFSYHQSLFVSVVSLSFWPKLSTLCVSPAGTYFLASVPAPFRLCGRLHVRLTQRSDA